MYLKGPLQQIDPVQHDDIHVFELSGSSPRRRTRARSMRTLRFLVIGHAGRLARIGGRPVLRLAHKPVTETLYAALDRRLTA